MIWLVFVEFSVEAWYRFHESRAAAVPTWTVPWPPKLAGLKELPITDRVREILGYDEGHEGQWQTEGGATWTINYFRWNPGKQQAWLSGIHRPDVCMASMGYALRDREDSLMTVKVGALELPFKVYTYEDAGNILHVFHCFWERRSAGKDTSPVEPNRSERLRTVLNGQRNLGQQTVQVAVHGIRDEAEATRALVSQLQSVIRIDPIH